MGVSGAEFRVSADAPAQVLQVTLMSPAEEGTGHITDSLRVCLTKSSTERR